MSDREPIHRIDVVIEVHAIAQDITIRRSYDTAPEAHSDLADLFAQVDRLLNLGGQP